MTVEAQKNEVEQIHQRYMDAAHLKPMDRLNEDDLDMLLLFESGWDTTRPIEKEVSSDFAERHGFKQDLAWSKSELWIKLDAPTDAKAIKPALKAMGYTYLETFQGAMRENVPRHWVLRGKKQAQPYFSDPEGHSKKLYELMCSVGLSPINAHAYPGMLFAEFELNTENLATITALMSDYHARGQKMVLSTNVTNAIDVIRVWPDGNAFNRAWHEKHALSVEQCLAMNLDL